MERKDIEHKGLSTHLKHPGLSCWIQRKASFHWVLRGEITTQPTGRDHWRPYTSLDQDICFDM